MSKAKGATLDMALAQMENRIHAGFEYMVKDWRAGIELAHREARLSSYGYDGAMWGRGPSSMISSCVGQIRFAEEKRDSAMAFVNGIRAFKELIDAGLLPVSEAIRNVIAERGDACRIAMAEIIAAPGHIRIHRERCQEINSTNDAREEAESLFGLGKGALGRTRHARSDSVATHDLDGTKRFPG